MASSSNTKNFFATSLSQLQNFIKRDATSYKDEVHSFSSQTIQYTLFLRFLCLFCLWKFLQTYQNYESTLQVYLMKPGKPNKQLADLALFLSHVSQCFPDELKAYPQQLIDILKKYSTVLHKEMRLVSYLIHFLTQSFANHLNLFCYNLISKRLFASA